MKFTGERLVPGEVDIELEDEHLMRYKFVSSYLNNKTILDAACGAGYGSFILSKKNVEVIGIDISKEAISYANKKYNKTNLKFIEANIERLPFEDNYFDAVVSFETIEHVDGNIQLKFLKEIKRVLTDDGVLVISTPNIDVYSNRDSNHFHVKEMNYEEFDVLLKSKFKFVDYYGQHRESCDFIVSSENSQAIIENELELNRCEYFVAVCSNKELIKLDSNVKINNREELKKTKSWAIENHKTNEYLHRELKRLQEENKEVTDKLIMSKNNIREDELIKQNMGIEISQLKEVCINLECKNEILKYKNDLLKDENGKQKCKSELLLNEYSSSKENLINKINDLNQTIKNKEGHINLLLESDRTLTNIINSKSWKIIIFFQSIINFIFPLNSFRRLFIYLIISFFRNPIKFFKKINKKSIREFISQLKQRRIESILEGVNNSLNSVVGIKVEKVDDKPLEEYTKIEIPHFDNIEVSIIIPVYNQFHFTYKCIETIVQNTNDVNYEIILGDDNSSDFTVDISKVIKGLKVVRNKENLRFLKNCNSAAKKAIGKYILFLNNDTQVQYDWLKPLVDLMEDERVGLVGSKLVYPNGLLQEAGGIVWKDASAWNFGNQKDPDFPDYNYVREVDYISGASIMIRTSLWNKIGGFDINYAPAYYEDTDLAFAVRREGYLVKYQPKSVVVHFEGISNGTDLSEGQKKFQNINKEKFLLKWKNVLELENYENGTKLSYALDRSSKKKHILVVDHYIPQYDKDAGSKCTFLYLKLFVDLGMKVTFIPDNFYKDTDYLEVYQQLGINVLYGEYYMNNYESWIIDNAQYIDYAYLNRPHISEKYIDLLKKHTKAKIIYFGHDLHHIRLSREYELTKDKKTLELANEWKEREFNLFKKADVIYVVGEYERNIVGKYFKNKEIRNIPVYFYENLNEDKINFENRKDIMFVGGFGHSPNEDAVIWFYKYIYPILKNNIPDLKWYIIGSKPTDKVKALASDNIIVTGFISDEKLSSYYKSCKIAVVPLRYGAGVKGKVIEAIYNNIPLVTTTIGSEGLSKKESAFIEAELNSDMADKIIDMYNDNNKLSLISENCNKFITSYFTVECAKEIILRDIKL